MVKPSKKLKKIFLITGITGSVYVGFKYLLPLVIPFVAADMAALCLRPSTRWLSRRLEVSFRGRQYRVSAGAVGAIELMILAAVLGGLAYWGLWKLCQEAALISERFPDWIRALDVWLTGRCHRVEEFLSLRPDCLVGMVREMLAGLTETMKRTTMPFLMENSVAFLEQAVKALVMCVLFFLATILSLEEMDDLKRRRDNSIFRREYAMIGSRLATAGKAYLKTQGCALALTIGVCTAGLWLLGSPYYIILGILIGLLDALPVLGTGTVFIPWALFLAAGGHWGRAAGMAVLYLVCYFLREFLEARIMGNEIGLTPLESLASIYVGWQLFGFLGFILGPVGLILIEDLVDAAEAGWKRQGEDCQ